MIKRIKSLIAIILTIATLSVAAYADDTINVEPMRASEYIAAYNVFTEAPVGTDDEVGVYFSIVTVGMMDELGATKISVYRSKTRTGSGSLVGNYYATGTNAAWIDHNSASHTGQLEIKVTPGYWYYAEVTLVASDETGGDSRIVETGRAWI